MATIQLNEAAVRAAFEAATSQADYLVALYRMVLPAWDTIERIEHWPACNDTTWKAVCRLAQQADRRLGLDVLPGGAWLNHGFTTRSGEDLADWQVSTDTCHIVYRKPTAVCS